MFGTNKNISVLQSPGFPAFQFRTSLGINTLQQYQLQENRIPVAEEDPAIEAIEARAPRSSSGTRAPDWVSARCLLIGLLGLVGSCWIVRVPKNPHRPTTHRIQRSSLMAKPCIFSAKASCSLGDAPVGELPGVGPASAWQCYGGSGQKQQTTTVFVGPRGNPSQ